MKKGWVSASLLAICAWSNAQVVGAFDGSRLYDPEMNLASGALMTAFRENFLSRGAPVTTTYTLTPQYLAGVSVFVTSDIINVVPSQDEVAAMVAWVQAGGTFVVTGECG